MIHLRKNMDTEYGSDFWCNSLECAHEVVKPQDASCIMCLKEAAEFGRQCLIRLFDLEGIRLADEDE